MQIINLTSVVVKCDLEEGAPFMMYQYFKEEKVPGNGHLKVYWNSSLWKDPELQKERIIARFKVTPKSN
jgi:hypothetical protein